MELIADGLLIATALTAALYCVILGRRLRRLTDAETGIATQIMALNKALDETRAALADTRRGVTEARGSARGTTDALAREVAAARQAAAEIERATRGATDTLSRLRAAQRWGDDPGEDIPDWPDGVVPEPDGPASDGIPDMAATDDAAGHLPADPDRPVGIAARREGAAGAAAVGSDLPMIDAQELPQDLAKTNDPADVWAADGAESAVEPGPGAPPDPVSGGTLMVGAPAPSNDAAHDPAEPAANRETAEPAELAAPEPARRASARSSGAPLKVERMLL